MSALTVKDCAEEMKVGHSTVIDWINAGELVAFIPPGKDPGQKKRGPKGYRVFPEDWERFKRARRYTGAGATPTMSSSAPAWSPSCGTPTGTDGVKRRGRKRALAARASS